MAAVDIDIPVDSEPQFCIPGDFERQAEVFKEQGNVFYSQKAYSDAFNCYTKAIDAWPKNASYYGNRAATLMMLSRFREALEDSQQAVRLDDFFMKGHLREGKCHLSLGNAKAASRCFKKVLELEPSNREAKQENKTAENLMELEKMANFGFEKRDFRKVVFCMDRALAVASACHRFKIFKAECLALLGRYPEAQSVASDILRLDSTNADALYVRGLCLYYEDCIDKAVQFFIQALRMAPDHEKARLACRNAKALKAKKDEGNQAFKKFNFEAAYQLYTEALAIDPNNIKTNAKLYCNRATAGAKLNKVNQTIEDCTNAIKLDDTYIKAYLRRAQSYMDTEQYEEAVRDYEKVYQTEKTSEHKHLLKTAQLELKKSKRKDYYKVLGVAKNATEDEIKKAYRKRALMHHPDRHSSATAEVQKEEEKKFKEVGEAFTVLSDPKKKIRYDNGHDLDDDGGFSGRDFDANDIFRAFFGGHNDGFSFGSGQGPVLLSAAMSAKAISEQTGKEFLYKYICTSAAVQNRFRYARVTAETDWDRLTQEHPWLLTERLVVKPDQLIKRRGKLGLVGIDLDLQGVREWLSSHLMQETTVGKAKGILKNFLIEPFVPHVQEDEFYVCIYATREGDHVLFHHEGGVEVGDVDAKAQRLMVAVDDKLTEEQVSEQLLIHVSDDKKAVLANFIVGLFSLYEDLNFTYLEINPLVVTGDGVYVLDMAAKIDATAEYICKPKWGDVEFPPPFGREAYPEEAYIADLDAKSGASLKLTLLNPRGRIWTMVAGGGASVVYSDTICDLGGVDELANYGEYSGAPSEQQTYDYAKTILSLMTRERHAEGKVLIIGGSIANFTNVAATFKGIVRAIKDYQTPLKEHEVTIFVRRGGPNYQEGLRVMGEVAKATTLFRKQTKAIVWGMQTRAVQGMLDFDYVCSRDDPSVTAMVYPFTGDHKQKFYWGHKEILLPVYKNMADAMRKHPEVDVVISFASLRSAFDSTMEVMQYSQIHTIAIIAEGIPEAQTRKIIKVADEKGVTIIGPATVGGIKPGCFKIGNTGGMLDNILASKLYRPGSVAYVSRSGGMSNELNNIISRTTDGVFEGVAIGGDRYPGSTFMDHVIRYQDTPGIKMIVVLGEIGGTEEYKICQGIKEGRITKPVVCWCIGTCATMFASEVQFGHAGACANQASETAVAKNQALREAGAYVPKSFDELGDVIGTVYEKLVANGTIVPAEEVPPPTVPMDYSWARELGLIRKPASFMTSICDERGQELIYAGMPITEVFKEEMGLGGVLGLLWFQRRLPRYACQFIEMCLMVTADHGPAVSGAHNTIVCARAGKDLVSSLTSGLLTIGDRFGGALDAAAKQFSKAFDSGMLPMEFVNKMKKDGKLIMGIGHRVKSINNPDMRVQILKDFVKQHFTSTQLLDYALDVEKITTCKKPNLILNVDGFIGVAFVDLLRTCGGFTRDEADEFVEIGALNGVFVLGRSMGFIGHYLDQKRLKQGLYRHPWDDISYVLPEHMSM
ncbi:ATP-citrate synthase [Takifugu flavidus]|uniref:ATP-citrate synthase n=1 Tax=Takifugu flavidus TaxID=433684 RepID=A0A5C6PSV7_9TELE|nr:ATP-citrate synthase [Takifugu flavidus]